MGKLLQALTGMQEGFNKYATDTHKMFESIITSQKSADDRMTKLEEANEAQTKAFDELLQKVPAAGGARDLLSQGAGGLRTKERDVLCKQLAFMLTHKVGQDAAEEKALQIGIGASGGFLIPMPVQAEIVMKAKLKSIMLDNADIIEPAPMAGQTHREDGTFTFSATAELAQPTETTFSDLLKAITWNLTKQGAFASMSNDLIRFVPLDLVAYLSGQAASAWGAKADDFYVNGSGSGEPRGLRIGENVNSAAQAAANFDWPDLLTLEAALPIQYRDQAVFILNDEARTLLVNIQETTGRPMFESATELKKLGIDSDFKNQTGQIRLPGRSYPYFLVSSTALPNTLGSGSDETEIWFIWPKAYRIWSGGEMEMSQDSSGANWRIGQTQIKFEIRSDGVVMLGEATSKLTGVK